MHSYLHYGLLAARAEILKAGDESGNPCVLVGFHGKFYFCFIVDSLVSC